MSTTTTRVNRAFMLGMLIGGLVVVMTFWFMATADAAAADETSVCDTYAAPASCNLENPPTLFTPAPPEKAWNCVEKEEIGHCSELLAQTGQQNNLHLVAIGLVAVSVGGIVTIAVIWMRHAASKREDSNA
ncbi:membrane protein [Microbacterium phage Hannabella]|nr:membrane protein [Microbacterium phage Hannabella]